MPSYKYVCKSTDCNNESLIDCKMSEYKSEISCEKCGGIMVRKPNDLVCGLSVDKTGDFYRSTN